MLQENCNVEVFILNHYDQHKNFDDRIVNVSVPGTRVNRLYVSSGIVKMMINNGYSNSEIMITSISSVSFPVPQNENTQLQARNIVGTSNHANVQSGNIDIMPNQ